MINYFTTFIYTNGLAFPDTLTINASGPSATDGTEVTKNMIDDFWGARYALLDRAGISPNNIAEAPGASQMIEATEKAYGLGAGVYKTWGLDLDPAVTGHRVLLLNNQGVLRTSYPDLDAATYVGDPDNPTAPYFYRADDAAGTIRNIAGTYLILPPGKQLYEKQYLGDGTDFTVTGTNWTTLRAIAIPYQTEDGAWRMRFNIVGAITSAVLTTFTIAISGVLFKNIGSFFQGVTCFQFNANNFIRSSAIPNTNNIDIDHASGTTTGYGFSGDVELDAEPSWTDGFNYKLGITY